MIFILKMKYIATLLVAGILLVGSTTQAATSTDMITGEATAPTGSRTNAGLNVTTNNNSNANKPAAPGTTTVVATPTSATSTSIAATPTATSTITMTATTTNMDAARLQMIQQIIKLLAQLTLILSQLSV
jgi:hypothetical protein